MKWKKELKKCVIRTYFLVEKGSGPVQREYLRLVLNAYPHLAEKINEQHLAGQKRSIIVNELLPKVEIDTIRRQVYRSSASSGEPSDAPNIEEIAEDVGQDAETDGIDVLVEVQEAEQRPLMEP